LYNLALTCMEMDKLDEAERHARRSLTIMEKRFGVDHLELAPNLFTLGQICLKAGKSREAIDLMERSQKIAAAQKE
jgi:tetratricopeptide (TPR) repeat protein